MKLDIFYLVALILASIVVIEVQCKANLLIVAKDYDELDIHHLGKQLGIINTPEAIRWNLWPEEKCKNLIAEYNNDGRSPNDCYLHEPTKWNLYPKYDWQEITSIYEPIVSVLVKKTQTALPLDKKYYENLSGNPKSIKLNLKNEVIESISHTNIQGNVDGVDSTIGISIFTSETDTPLSYDHLWGKEDQRSRTKVVQGSNSYFVLPGYSNATVALYSYQVKAEFEVTYRNRLEGYVATHYDPKYNQHWFYAYNTRNLKPSQNATLFKETILLNYYHGGYLQVNMTLPQEENRTNILLLNQSSQEDNLYADDL